MTCKAEVAGTQCERKGGHKGSHEGYQWVVWEDDHEKCTPGNCVIWGKQDLGEEECQLS